MTRLRAWLGMLSDRGPSPLHVHDFVVTGPEGHETYTCWCGFIHTRRPPEPERRQSGKGF